MSCDFPFNVQTSRDSSVNVQTSMTSFLAIQLHRRRVPLKFFIGYPPYCVFALFFGFPFSGPILGTHLKWIFFFFLHLIFKSSEPRITVPLCAKLQPYWGGRTCSGRGG